MCNRENIRPESELVVSLLYSPDDAVESTLLLVLHFSTKKPLVQKSPPKDLSGVSWCVPLSVFFLNPSISVQEKCLTYLGNCSLGGILCTSLVQMQQHQRPHLPGLSWMCFVC